MIKPICDCAERAKQEAERDGLWARTDALGGLLEHCQEITDEIDRAMHAFQTKPPDREVMKARSAELLKIAKEVKKAVKAF